MGEKLEAGKSWATVTSLHSFPGRLDLDARLAIYALLSS